MNWIDERFLTHPSKWESFLLRFRKPNTAHGATYKKMNGKIYILSVDLNDTEG